jgi:hypothetical protein
MFRNGFNFGEAKSKTLIVYPALVLTEGDGVQVNDDDIHGCIELWASWSREPSGHDLNNRNTGLLSGNHIYIVRRE